MTSDQMWTKPAAAVGRTVGVRRSDDVRTIVGVVEPVLHVRPGQASLPMLYLPRAQ